MTEEIIEVEEEAANQSYSSEPEHDLSDEELDAIADTAIEYLRDILKYFDAEDATIEEYEGDENELILDIVGADLAVLIGRHGKTLEALQTMLSVYVTKKMGFRYPVVVDIEGYKNRRKKKIEGLAFSAASRAARNQAPVRMQPMSPYERRIVHMALRDDNRVDTASEGEEPYRRVVVTPIL